jgi:hypothetical protein
MQTALAPAFDPHSLIEEVAQAKLPSARLRKARMVKPSRA